MNKNTLRFISFMWTIVHCDSAQQFEFQRIVQTNFLFYFNIFFLPFYKLRPILTLHKIIWTKPSEFDENKKKTKIDNYPVQELTIRKHCKREHLISL